jgi:hypothetical protein
MLHSNKASIPFKDNSNKNTETDINAVARSLS